MMTAYPRPQTYIRIGGGRIQLAAPVVEQLQRYSQQQPEDPEAGGVLLGRHIVDSQDIVVDYITTPMQGDKGSRFRFFRSRRAHQNAVNKAWQESGGTCTYLGGWHTHPEPDPRPSWTDLLDWQRHLAIDRYSQTLVFVIVGTRHIRAWEGTRFTRPAPLTLITEE